MREKKNFHFRQFSVNHDRCTMKVGTDAVLLGAWVDVKNASRILDIGTGSGVIALMLAQRTSPNGYIDAVEILEGDAIQAKENVQASLWKNKIFVHPVPVQEFAPDMKYDLIISNPPFFMDSQKPPDEKRHKARHTTSLSFQDLIDAIVRLLSNEGTFNVILPYTEGLHFRDQAMLRGLFCTRQFSFRGKKEKPVERWLMEFSYKLRAVECGEIILYTTDNKWSVEYRKLVGDFYLNDQL